MSKRKEVNMKEMLFGLITAVVLVAIIIFIG